MTPTPQQAAAILDQILARQEIRGTSIAEGFLIAQCLEVLKAFVAAPATAQPPQVLESQPAS